MKVVIACAGTGGHINPGIAIADLIMKKFIDSEVIFIGTKTGLENDLIPKAGYKIYSIRTGKLLRKITVENIKAVYNTYVGISDSEKILKGFKPDIVIGTGGYICVPVMLAAKRLHIPYMLHESNAFPGLSVKLLAKYSSCIMVGFKEALTRLNNMSNTVCTGTPSKFDSNDIQKLDIEKCKKDLEINNSDKKIVFITFGSQGAKSLNLLIIKMICEKLDKNILYILVTGKNNYEDVKNLVKNLEKEKGIDLSEFLDLRKFVYNMDKMYKVADLCITRAGALTINELSIALKPAILIPLPYAAENHQLYNAKVLGSIGAGVIIEEKDITVDLLYNEITKILNDKLSIMTMNFTKLEKQDVQKNIYNEILKVYKSSKK
ncbi:MAG: undecaprenyldiphospho-muramoylpentapeptide beta-N-acetylglucosaminyltransferase [Clostridia bacterium]